MIIKSDENKRKLLAILPPPPEGKTGWPWDKEVDPDIYGSAERLPKISIITPSFNQGKFIEKTIRSVLLQNYPNVEYLIFDGGSTDETIKIINKYSNWITYWTSEKDNGQTDAINKGIAKCSGTIFNWLNSDDFYSEDCFKILIDNFEPDKTKMLAGDYRIFLEDGTEEDKLIDFRLQQTIEETLAIVLINQPSCFFSLDSIKSLGELNVNLHYVMDQDIWKRFLFTYGQDDVKYVNKLLANFRIHSESKTYQFEFAKEYNMIFVSIARKCGMPLQAEFLEKFHGIQDSGQYEFKFNFDEKSVETGKGAINNVLYQIARSLFTAGDYAELGKCLSIIDSGYLNVKQRNYIQKLKIKKMLHKFNVLSIFNYFFKAGRSVSF